MNKIRGSRGNKANRAQRKVFLRSISVEARIATKGTINITRSSDNLILEGGKLREVFTHISDNGVETPVNDKSTTKNQHLRLFDQHVTETIDLKVYSIDINTGLRKQVNGVDVMGTNEKVLRMSDRTLLSQGKEREPVFKREESVTHYRKTDDDASLPLPQRKVFKK